MKKFIFAIGLTFTLALTLVIGLRMSPDAMAVIIGIICGVLASIPTSVILVWVLRQRDKQADLQAGNPGRYGHYPPVVVVNGQTPNGYGTPPMAPALPSSATMAGGREFKVIGQENTETVGDILPSLWD